MNGRERILAMIDGKPAGSLPCKRGTLTWQDVDHPYSQIAAIPFLPKRAACPAGRRGFMTRRQFIGSALISTMSTVLSRANEPPRWQIGCYTRPRAQYDYRVALDGIAAASCDYAAPKGVGLSIKPHGGNNANGVQCRKIIDQIDHKTFRFWYDSGNIFYYSDGKLDPVDDAATVNGVVVGMSVKDFRSPKEVELTPGTGKVDFAKVLSRLQQGGFTRGPLVVECLDPGDVAHVNAEAVKARQFLEALTGQKA